VSTIANYIRDAAVTRIVAANIKPWKAVRKSPIPTLQTDQLPALGIYMMRENMSPDGDSNCGPPRFIADAVISFAVIDLASKPDVLDGSVDTAIDLIETTLLCDGSFIDLRDLNGQPIIDSITNISRSYQFPQIGETYYLECRLQITFRYFCFFEPVAPNLLTTVSVKASPNAGDGTPIPTDPNNLDIILGS